VQAPGVRAVRVALSDMAAASVPASGSVMQMAGMVRPEAMPGSQAACWAGVALRTMMSLTSPEVMMR
jgi:hypothetical protein